MTDNLPTFETPPTPMPESEPSAAPMAIPAVPDSGTIPPEQNGPQPSTPVSHVRPVRRRKWLIMSLVVLAVLLLAAGGGFAYLRLSETNLLERAQVDLASGNWLAVDTGCSQLMSLPVNLLVEPQRCLPLRGEAYYQLGRLDQAQIDLKAAQDRYPDLARPYLLSAEIYLQQDQADLALSAASETIERDPTLVRPHMLMTEIYLQQGKSDLALASAGEAQELDETLALPYTLQAVDAYRRNLPIEAEKAARAALERDDDQAPALRVLGSLQAWRSEYQAALENLNKALELDPEDQNALIERAVVYFHLDQISDFRADAQTILALDTTSPGALMIQALQADLAHQPQKAYDFANQAVQLDGSRPEYYYLRASLFPTTEKENQGKLADLARALELNPDLYLAQWMNLTIRWEMYEQVDLVAEAGRLRQAAPELGAGYALMIADFTRQMDLAQALDWANRYVEAMPALNHPYATRAGVYILQQEYEKAQADLEKALEITPDSASIRVGLVRIKIGQKNKTEALKLADDVITLAPDLPEGYNARALAHSMNAEPELARKDVDQALKLDPLNVNALAQSVFLYIADKDYLKATEAISKIADIAPKAPNSFTLRASVYQAQADYQRALEEVKKSIEIDPKDPLTQDMAAQACFNLEQFDQTLGYATAAIRLDAKDDVAWGLSAEALYARQAYDLAIVDANKSLEINPEQIALYQIVSDASLAQGDYVTAASSLEKALKYAGQMTVDQVDLFEQTLAFYKTVPPLVNGLRTVNDPEHGFNVAYSGDWRPLGNDISTIYLTLTSKNGNDIKVAVTTQPVDDPNAYLYTTQMFADFMRELFTKSGFKFTERTSFEGLQPGIVDTFEITGKLWDDEDPQKLKGQLYYFYIPGRLVVLEFTTPVALFTTYVGKVEKIAAALKVIK